MKRGHSRHEPMAGGSVGVHTIRIVRTAGGELRARACRRVVAHKRVSKVPLSVVACRPRRERITPGRSRWDTAWSRVDQTVCGLSSDVAPV